MYTIFYKRCWNILDINIYGMSKAFLKSSHMLHELNRIIITLIPKISNPSKVPNYRHISLYNVSYKFTSKFLITRLCFVLPKVIFPLQGAFMKNIDIHEYFNCS